MSSIKCGGFCCRSFYLPFTLDDIKERLQSNKKDHESLAYALDNFIQKRTCGWRNVEYTCKQFNWKTGLCNDYENRPPVCRSFPRDGNASNCQSEYCIAKRDKIKKIQEKSEAGRDFPESPSELITKGIFLKGEYVRGR